MKLKVVILAAGQGARMHSRIPKVLHRLADQPLLHHVVKTAETLDPEVIYIVAGHQYDKLHEQCVGLNVTWLHQKELLGTAHALSSVLPQLEGNERVLVLFGDVPLVTNETLTLLLQQSPPDGLGLVLAEFDDPSGLGRVIRDESHNIVKIVEHKDATEEQKKIKEIFAGLLVAPAEALSRWLPAIKNENAQSEYYLVDIIPMALHESRSVHGVLATPNFQVQGVNDHCQLALLERYYQNHKMQELMQQGVTMLDPARVDIRGEVCVGKDTVLDVNVILSGQTHIGVNCRIDSNVVLHNVTLGDNVHVKAFSHLEDVVVNQDCIVGPFARLRPGTELEQGVHIGNFVELKAAKVAARSKINHHSYIGDSILGQDVNIGAGTITCNYDGAKKHQTKIGDSAFIGSNTNLVAPVNIGNNATVGAGSTIRKDVPDGALMFNPVEEKIKASWQRPTKKIKE